MFLVQRTMEEGFSVHRIYGLSSCGLPNILVECKIKVIMSSVCQKLGHWHIINCLCFHWQCGSLQSVSS